MGSIKIKGTTSGSILLTAPDTGADNVPVEFDTFLAKTGDGSGLTGLVFDSITGTSKSLLTLHNTTNAAGAGIKFSDQNNGDQTGNLNFHHADSQGPTGSGYGATFKFETNQSKLAVQIPGAGDFFVGSNKVIYDAGKSHAQSGYQKLSNGLIIQWGLSSADPTYFPISFPSACFSVVATVYNGNNDYEASLVNTITKSSFRFKNKYYNKSRYYIAIGH